MLLILLSTFFRFSDAVTCHSCFSLNNQLCVNAGSCSSNYCLYEKIVSPNGNTHLLRTCRDKDFYMFDDGLTATFGGQCITRTTTKGTYSVALCSSGDYCNLNCSTTALTTTIAPVFPTVTCYNCETTDGTDCTSAVCQGNFCLYERRTTNNVVYLRKSCLTQPRVLLDDQTVVDGVDICEVRNTASSNYQVKICNDLNLCNEVCSPGLSPAITSTPQRQPLLTCYNCESYGSDCFTGSCSANFCLFERQYRTSTGATYYKKSCASVALVDYPDGTKSNLVNQCEYRTINDVEYQVKVCNDGTLCNSACPSRDGTNGITCTQCEAKNKDDCTSATTCSGQYCIFERQTSLTTGGTYVKKSCTNENMMNYPDGTQYRSYGQCEYRTIGSTVYVYKTCNGSNYCNVACPDSIEPTPSSAHAVRVALGLLVFVVHLL